MTSNLFAEYKHLAYRLYAVFMHHGSVEFGHYYIYIYDFEKNIWRKYNDNDVREVQDTAEIFAVQQSENPPTPYFLVYVNDTMKDRLANPVCREVFDPFPSEQSQQQQQGQQPGAVPAEDTTMEDATSTIFPEKPVTASADPPAYDEVLAEGGVPGTGANANLPTFGQEKDGNDNAVEGSDGRWTSSNQTNFSDVQW